MFVNFVNRLPPFVKELICNNITREWIKLGTNTSPTRIFYLNDQLSLQNKLHACDTIRQTNIRLATEFYTANLKPWIGNKSSFGIVHRYFLQSNHDLVLEKSLDLLNSDVHQVISLLIFCPKEETFQLQQMLSHIRYHWYRKLSKSPLSSGYKSKLNEEDNTFVINYQPKHVQNATNDLEFKLDEIIFNQTEQREEFEDISPDFDMITCNTNLATCLTALIDDSFCLLEDDKIVLKLNPLIVPFKLAITVDPATTKAAITSNLFTVADHLISSLKEYPDITVFPFVRNNLITVDGSDKLGIQYTVVLQEETLTNGVVLLRNRDTQIPEMVHISNFLKTILFYLQPEKLINYEEPNITS